MSKKIDKLNKYVNEGSGFNQTTDKKKTSKVAKHNDSKILKQDTVKTELQQNGKISREGEKMTLYFRKDTARGLRVLAAETGEKMSLLANEAIEDLLRKYGKYV